MTDGPSKHVCKNQKKSYREHRSWFVEWKVNTDDERTVEKCFGFKYLNNFFRLNYITFLISNNHDNIFQLFLLSSFQNTAVIKTTQSSDNEKRNFKKTFKDIWSCKKFVFWFLHKHFAYRIYSNKPRGAY